MPQVVHIIGGGLAGSEAAWQLVQHGVPVVIHEMRPVQTTPAHTTDKLAELVCSNSFRSDDAEHNAVGLLHEEMRRCDSLVMQAANSCKVPAGGALAVDREGFANKVTAALRENALVTIVREESTTLPVSRAEQTIVASGPLTSSALAESICALTGQDALAFFDAIAPIVYRDSINMEHAWYQSRYDKEGPGGGTADYINCAMEREQYDIFVNELRTASRTELHEWEKNTPYFSGCLPIEVMAERGLDTLRYGPMKPVGLTDPRTGRRPWAVVQLRQDNSLGTLYNIVGFQTKLRYGEQSRILRLIPGLEKAEFARLGGLHRNTFINSPLLLDAQLRLKTLPSLRFAGQITGVEGYVESAAMGLLAGRFAAADILGHMLTPPPRNTALGALLAHITGNANAETFQPMNVNFGLFPPLTGALEEGASLPKGKRPRHDPRANKAALAARARADLTGWLAEGSNQ